MSNETHEILPEEQTAVVLDNGVDIHAEEDSQRYPSTNTFEGCIMYPKLPVKLVKARNTSSVFAIKSYGGSDTMISPVTKPTAVSSKKEVNESFKTGRASREHKTMEMDPDNASSNCFEVGIKKASKSLRSRIKKATKSVGSKIKKASKTVSNGIEKTAVAGIVKPSKAVGSGIKKASKAVGSGIKKTAVAGIVKPSKAVGSGIKKASKAVGSGIKKTAVAGIVKPSKAVGSGIKKTAVAGIVKPSKAVGSGIKKATKSFLAKVKTFRICLL